MKLKKRAKAITRLLVPLMILIGVGTIGAGQSQAQPDMVLKNGQMNFGAAGSCLGTTDSGIACFLKGSGKKINLSHDGETYVLKRGDNIVPPNNSVTLFRGDYVWKKKGVSCTVFGKTWKRAGVKCTNGEHGFRLQKGKKLKTF